MTIILPIKVEYAKSIFAFTKHYEFRKTLPKKLVSKIIVYACAPIKMCIGEVEVLGTISDTVEKLWVKTAEYAGISRGKYTLYFRERSTAYAYILGQTTLYDSPLPITDFGLSRPPQNFAYYATNKTGMSNEPLKQYSVSPVE